MIFKRVLSAVGMLMLIASSAYAGTDSQSWKSLKEGEIVQGDRIKSDSDAEIPIPQGTWKVLKRLDFYVKHHDVNYTRLTLVNQDVSSPLRFFSVMSRPEDSRKAGGPPLWQCKDIPGGFTQAYALSTSLWNYACSTAHQYKALKDVFAAVVKVNWFDYGFTEGVMQPLLQSEADLNSLGSAPMLVHTRVVRDSVRDYRYTFGFRIPDKDLNAKSPNLKMVFEWLDPFVRSVILAANHDPYVAPAFKEKFVEIGIPMEPPVIREEVVAIAPASLPLQDPLQVKKMADFIATTSGKNRVCAISAKGADWACMVGMWPYNEQNAISNCARLASGKGVHCRFYLINNEIVSAESSDAKN